MMRLQSIETRHRDYVGAFTRNHFPYSDFNFTSMWAWDTHGHMRIGELHDNLVVRFTDYLTGEAFYSFFGSNMINETVEYLLSLSEDEHIKPILKLIPEHSIQDLNLSIFLASEDRDHFDYIYDMQELSLGSGNKFSTYRHMINRFTSRYVNCIPCLISVEINKLHLVREHVETTNNKWLLNKTNQEDYAHEESEFIAIQRVFAACHDDMHAVCIFYDKSLVAYMIIEIIDTEYTLAHFAKADISYTGINQFLMKKTSEFVVSRSRKLLNVEQDLGLPGLRQTKLTMRPCHFLKKYTIARI